MRFLLGFAAGLIGAILGGRMAWPRDKRRIIEALETSILCFWRVEFFIEEVLDRTNDPELIEEGKRALQCVKAVKRAWRQIRSQDFEQGILFDERRKNQG